MSQSQYIARPTYLKVAAKGFELRAKVVAELADSSTGQLLRFSWDQLAVTYKNLEKRCLETDAGFDGLSALSEFRAWMLAIAKACQAHSDRMRDLASEEGDTKKQKELLSLSEHYGLLRDELLTLEALASKQGRR